MFSTLTAAIRNATEDSTPRTKLSPYTKQWWSPELATLRQEKRRLANKSYHLRSQRLHPVHDESQAATCRYMEAIEKAKREHWEQWLKDVNSDNIWTAHKYAGNPPTDSGAARIPTLKKQTNGRTEKVDTNEEKSKLLYETFFPRPPQRPPANASTQYPEPACKFTPISDEQVH